MERIINFAHRGASAVCPENTMSSFTKGLELGASGIETDVQMTKDGQLVLIHDESVQRTTDGKGFVKDMNFDELSMYDAGSWFGHSFKSERIPLLEELLDLLRERDTILNIELKNGIFMYPGMEKKVIDLVRQFGMTERVILSSFNHYSLVHCKSIAPEIRTGILYMEGLYRPWNYAVSVGAETLHANHLTVRPELVVEAEKHGITYLPFTANSPDRMKTLIHAGVSGMITDYPDVLDKILSNRSV
ncbi:glycerophosphodiester phosphodiesterase [Paenibacillus sp. CMAA1364]